MLIHGHRASNARRTPTYLSWVAMKQRCLNPKHKWYHYYGGRGITVCQSWRDSFVAFLLDMGERPAGLTLERKNVNRPYTPHNCCWADKSTQRRNRRLPDAAAKSLQ
jgi:hypothetical protein